MVVIVETDEVIVLDEECEISTKWHKWIYEVVENIVALSSSLFS